MNLLIVAGPYQGERLRKAAEAERVHAEIVEAIDQLTPEIAGRPWDAVLLATTGTLDAIRAEVNAVRDATSAMVPVFFLGDRSEHVAVADLVRGTFERQVQPQDVLAQMRSALAAWAKEDVTFAGPQRAATPGLGQPSGIETMLLRVMQGIDETLEQEMLATARIVVADEERSDAEAASRDLLRARIGTRYALVEEGDYFSFLGIVRGAATREITIAVAAVEAEVAAFESKGDSSAKAAEEVAAIRTVLTEARRILEPDKRRRAYEAHLPPTASSRVDATVDGRAVSA